MEELRIYGRVGDSIWMSFRKHDEKEDTKGRLKRDQTEGRCAFGLSLVSLWSLFSLSLLSVFTGQCTEMAGHC